MNIKSSGQIPFFDEDPQVERDRNFEEGGRSFYFFDFDDNVVHLPTKIILFDRNTHEELQVSTTEYAAIHPKLGEAGSKWENFELRDNPMGSYRNFREHPKELLDGKEQPLVEAHAHGTQKPFSRVEGALRGTSFTRRLKTIARSRLSPHVVTTHTPFAVPSTCWCSRVISL